MTAALMRSRGTSMSLGETHNLPSSGAVGAFDKSLGQGKRDSINESNQIRYGRTGRNTV